MADSPITVSDPHEYACEHPTSFVGVGRDVYFGGRCYFRAELNSAYACHVSPAEFRHMTADEQTNCMAAGTREAMARITTMTTPIPTPAATPLVIPRCGGPLGLTHDCVSTVGAMGPATYVPSSSSSPIPDGGFPSLSSLPDPSMLTMLIPLAVWVALFVICRRLRTFAETEANALGWLGLIIHPLRLFGKVGVYLLAWCRL
jgi:hypothetical protein